MLLKKATLAGCAVALATLTGCANIRGVTSDVTSFSNWPAERKPASYVYERLPSQQAQAAEQDLLEQSARRALEDAGFTPASNASAADVNIQLSSRVNQYDRVGPYDRFGFFGGFGGGGRRGGGGVGIGFGGGLYDVPYYEREVSVLIRDRRTGQSLYETHARNGGNTAGNPDVLEPMFSAAMKDFPSAAVNPRRIVIDNGQ